MDCHHIDKYVNEFTSKNVSDAANTKYTSAVILLVLLAASFGGHSIYSKAISPDADTVIYRIDTTIRQLENQFWRQGLDFLKRKRRHLARMKCYIVVDETHDSYTGKLLKKAKKAREKLSARDKQALKYIHSYKPDKGDTGSYKYLVIAIVYGNRRRVLLVKALKNKEHYKHFIIKTLIHLREEVNYECVLFDRGFYDGLFIDELRKHDIPFIVRARISKTMKKEYGFYSKWECYKDYVIGEHKVPAELVLGVDYTQGKRTQWAFITNLALSNWRDVREIYRKRWNIENIFKATDGIQLRVQSSNPTLRMFCVCLSFLFYNAWQRKNKKTRPSLIGFLLETLELIFEIVARIMVSYRDKLRIRLPFWDRIIES